MWHLAEVAWVGEAEAGVAGGAFGEGRGEHAGGGGGGGGVAIVVDLGGCLARIRAQDAPGVLDQGPLNATGAARNRVSSTGQSKPSADIRPGGHGEHRSAGLGLEAGQGGRSDYRSDCLELKLTLEVY